MKWHRKSYKHIYNKLLNNLNNKNWPLDNSDIKIWLEFWMAQIQFKLIFKFEKYNTRIIKLNIKNYVKSSIYKIFFALYAANHLLINKTMQIMSIHQACWEKNRDKKINKNFKNAINQVFKINSILKNYHILKHQIILKQSFIHFKFLKIVTLLNYSLQKILQLLLNPITDVLLGSNSYGFRKYKSSHQAIFNLTNLLNKAKNDSFIIEWSIKKFVKKIYSQWIYLNLSIITDLKLILKTWFNYNIFNKWETLQNGTMIALTTNFIIIDFKNMLSSKNFSILTKKNEFKLITYVNSFIIIISSLINLKLIKKKIQTYLKLKKFQINKEKFKIIFFPKMGIWKKKFIYKFNFLNLTFMKYIYIQPAIFNKKKEVIVLPSTVSILSLKKNVRIFMYKNSNMTLLKLFKKINSILKNWSRYFTIFLSTKTFKAVNNCIYNLLWKWCFHKNYKIGKFRLIQKYFVIINNQKNVSNLLKKWDNYSLIRPEITKDKK